MPRPVPEQDRLKPFDDIMPCGWPFSDETGRVGLCAIESPKMSVAPLQFLLLVFAGWVNRHHALCPDRHLAPDAVELSGVMKCGWYFMLAASASLVYGAAPADGAIDFRLRRALPGIVLNANHTSA
jgi:hypothetical protein